MMKNVLGTEHFPETQPASLAKTSEHVASMAIVITEFHHVVCLN
jgi:hypothetical protein